MKILDKKTYIETLKLSDGIKAFRHLYAVLDDRQEKDLTENGELSCAVFVSAILTRFNSPSRNFKLIDESHATVSSLIKDLERNGWYKIDELKEGAIILWGPGVDSNNHNHVGFYLGSGMTISNSSKDKQTIIHPVDKDGRKVEMILSHNFLND